MSCEQWANPMLVAQGSRLKAQSLNSYVKSRKFKKEFLH